MPESAEGPYARHDLVRAEPEAWAALLRERPGLAGLPHLADWAKAGRPLVVRRFVPGEGRDLVPLGLPLPPSDGKRRIGLALPASALMPVSGPDLAEAAPHAPPPWRPTLDALLALGVRVGSTPRPFGSLLWQAATGLGYLAARSDLDLLWPCPASAAALDDLLGEIAELAAGAPMRLDGEILFPDGGGVHWRELRDASEGGTVLVKYLERAALVPAASLRGLSAAA